jgi:hypothetical protein
MTATATNVQTRLANLLLKMRGQSHDYQGLGHAEPYGNSEAAWDDAGELLAEAQDDHETAQEEAQLEGEALFRAAAESPGSFHACRVTQLEGEALFRAALAIHVANETARLARVDSHKAEAAAALKTWTAEASKTRKGLAAARQALKA